MNQAAKKPVGSAYDRILSVAADLFYRQGYRATGINEIIEKSGVAKATFYNHFPSKDELCVASLNLLRSNEMSFIESAIAAAKGPVERFLSVLTSLEKWAIDTEFRGCAFMNISAEVPDPNSPMRKVGTRLYDDIRKRVEKLAIELMESDSKRYDHLDVTLLSNDYMTAFAGAVAQAEIYHAIWPIDHAVENMRRMIDQ